MFYTFVHRSSVSWASTDCLKCSHLFTNTSGRSRCCRWRWEAFPRATWELAPGRRCVQGEERELHRGSRVLIWGETGRCWHSLTQALLTRERWEMGQTEDGTGADGLLSRGERGKRGVSVSPAWQLGMSAWWNSAVARASWAGTWLSSQLRQEDYRASSAIQQILSWPGLWETMSKQTNH